MVCPHCSWYFLLLCRCLWGWPSRPLWLDPLLWRRRHAFTTSTMRRALDPSFAVNVGGNTNQHQHTPTSTSQPTNQHTNQSTNHHTNQPTIPHTNQPTDAPTTQSPHQPTNHHTNQPASQSINQPTNQPQQNTPTHPPIHQPNNTPINQSTN